MAPRDHHLLDAQHVDDLIDALRNVNRTMVRLTAVLQELGPDIKKLVADFSLVLAPPTPPPEPNEEP